MKHLEIGQVWRMKNMAPFAEWNRFEVLAVKDGWVKYRMVSNTPIPQPSITTRLGSRWVGFGGFLRTFVRD